MASPLPILYNTTGTLNAQVKYGFSRTVSFMTQVTVFWNGSEQRWAMRPPLYQFTIPLSNLVTADKASWSTFFANAKGRFGQDISVTLGSTTYDNLGLVSDDLVQTAQSSSGQVFNQLISLRQVANDSWTPPTVGTAYPTFSWGGSCQYPFGQITSFLTTLNDSPMGPRYAFPWYAAGLTNFPTGPLMRWRITYPLLPDADLATLENFFISQQGRYASFSFTDPISGTTYSHVRFDDDSLVIRYITKNQSSAEVTLKQTNGS